jgi:tRNA (guanine37-N1)-methyltransferase
MDSFNPALDGLLDCGHYTRPEAWHDERVPPILMSGHHADIAKWRRQQSLALTQTHRPDLIESARALGKLSAKDEHFLRHLTSGGTSLA